MGKFNSGSVKDRKFTKNTVKNKAGGVVYNISDQAKLAGIIFTSLVDDTFYRTQKQFIVELKELIVKCDPEFVAKTAWKARHVYGLRSVSHLVTNILSTTGATSGVSWGSTFYDSIAMRPDDITEILALSDGKPSHAMRKGFTKSMQRFDEYQLAKYSGFNKTDGRINLNDVLRLCHVPFEKGTNNPLEKLMYRTLRSTHTVEAKGNTTEGWIDLLTNNRLGYTALVKNLKNIINKSDDTLTKLTCDELVNKKSVANSKLLPMYFLKAYQFLKTEFNNSPSIHARKIIEHLSKACDISLKNIKPLHGKTLILIDQSGSMRLIKDTAHLFACSFAHACDEYIVAAFSSSEYYGKQSCMNYIDTLTENSILNTSLNLPFRSGGTDFSGTYKQLMNDNIKVDRIIQITDQQEWTSSYYSGVPSYVDFRKWCKKVDMNPEVWSIDIAGLGTSVFPEDKIRTMYGISEKIFDLISEMEADPEAFVNSINDIQFLTTQEIKNKKRHKIEVTVQSNDVVEDELDPFEIV
jgi:hypothetical protein